MSTFSENISSKRSVFCVNCNSYSHVKFVNCVNVCSGMTFVLSSMTVLQVKKKKIKITITIIFEIINYYVIVVPFLSS